MPLRSITIYADIIKLKIKRKKRVKRNTLYFILFFLHTPHRGGEIGSAGEKKRTRRKKMIHEASSSVILDDNGLKTLDRWDEDWLDVREQRVLGVLLLVSLSRDSDSHSELDTSDTSLPDSLVQLRRETDILSTHVQLGELLDLLNGSWSSLLEGNTV